MKQLVVLARSQAREFTSDCPWACISIGARPSDLPKLSAAHRVGLLQLVFLDVDNSPGRAPNLPGGDPQDALFSEDHARQILEFVSRLWDDAELFMIHCNVGMSRSPAVAAAIDLIFNRSPSVKRWWEVFTPNFRVFDTILKVWQLTESGDTLETL